MSQGYNPFNGMTTGGFTDWASVNPELAGQLDYTNMASGSLGGGFNGGANPMSAFGGVGMPSQSGQSNPWSMGDFGTLAQGAGALWGMYNQDKGMNMAERQMGRQHRQTQRNNAIQDASRNSWA